MDGVINKIIREGWWSRFVVLKFDINNNNVGNGACVWIMVMDGTYMAPTN